MMNWIIIENRKVRQNKKEMSKLRNVISDNLMLVSFAYAKDSRNAIIAIYTYMRFLMYHVLVYSPVACLENELNWIQL